MMNPLRDWEGRYVKITVNEVYKGRVIGCYNESIRIEGPNKEKEWVTLTEGRNSIFSREYSIELEEPPMKNGYWHFLGTQLVLEYRDGEWFYLDGGPLSYIPNTANRIKYLGNRELE